jgi:hypothetical protein
MRDDEFFWEGARAQKLLFQKCTDCGALRHPPGPMCPQCQSLRWTAEASRGRGTVQTWIISRHPTKPDLEPRVVVLVALDEGVRVVSNLVGIASDAIRADMPVEVLFAEVSGSVLPQFKPAA